MTSNINIKLRSIYFKRRNILLSLKLIINIFLLRKQNKNLSVVCVFLKDEPERDAKEENKFYDREKRIENIFTFKGQNTLKS